MKHVIFLFPSFFLALSSTFLLATSRNPPRRGPKNPNSARYCVRSEPVIKKTVSCADLQKLYEACQKDKGQCEKFKEAVKIYGGTCTKKSF